MDDDDRLKMKDKLLPPAPTNHIDPRMHLRLHDMGEAADDGTRRTYPLAHTHS